MPVIVSKSDGSELQTKLTTSNREGCLTKDCPAKYYFNIKIGGSSDSITVLVSKQMSVMAQVPHDRHILYNSLRKHKLIKPSKLI